MKSNHASCTITLASKERIKQWATTEIPSALTNWGESTDADTQQFSQVDNKYISKSKGDKVLQKTATAKNSNTSTLYEWKQNQQNKTTSEGLVESLPSLLPKSDNNIPTFANNQPSFLAQILPRFFQKKNSVGYIISRNSKNQRLVRVGNNRNYSASAFSYQSQLQQIALIFTPLNSPDGDYMITNQAFPQSSPASVAFNKRIAAMQNTENFNASKALKSELSPRVQFVVPNEYTAPKFLKKHLSTLYLLEDEILEQEFSVPTTNANSVYKNSNASPSYGSVCRCSCFPISIQYNLSIDGSIQKRIKKNIETISYSRSINQKTVKIKKLDSYKPMVKQLEQLTVFEAGLGDINKIALFHSYPQAFQGIFKKRIAITEAELSQGKTKPMVFTKIVCTKNTHTRAQTHFRNEKSITKPAKQITQQTGKSNTKNWWWLSAEKLPQNFALQENPPINLSNISSKVGEQNRFELKQKSYPLPTLTTTGSRVGEKGNRNIVKPILLKVFAKTSTIINPNGLWTYSSFFCYLPIKLVLKHPISFSRLKQNNRLITNVIKIDSNDSQKTINANKDSGCLRTSASKINSFYFTPSKSVLAKTSQPLPKNSSSISEFAKQEQKFWLFQTQFFISLSGSGNRYKIKELYSFTKSEFLKERNHKFPPRRIRYDIRTDKKLDSAYYNRHSSPSNLPSAKVLSILNMMPQRSPQIIWQNLTLESRNKPTNNQTNFNYSGNGVSIGVGIPMKAYERLTPPTLYGLKVNRKKVLKIRGSMQIENVPDKSRKKSTVSGSRRILWKKTLFWNINLSGLISHDSYTASQMESKSSVVYSYCNEWQIKRCSSHVANSIQNHFVFYFYRNLLMVTILPFDFFESYFTFLRNEIHKNTQTNSGEAKRDYIYFFGSFFPPYNPYNLFSDFNNAVNVKTTFPGQRFFKYEAINSKGLIWKKHIKTKEEALPINKYPESGSEAHSVHTPPFESSNTTTIPAVTATVAATAKGNNNLLSVSDMAVDTNSSFKTENDSLQFGEVDVADTLNYRTLKPVQGGLFCETLFGPIKDWECQCGRLKFTRAPKTELWCPNCLVQITRSVVRRVRMGYIQLAAPIMHIWYKKQSNNPLVQALCLTPKQITSVLDGKLLCVSSTELISSCVPSISIFDFHTWESEIFAFISGEPSSLDCFGPWNTFHQKSFLKRDIDGISYLHNQTPLKYNPSSPSNKFTPTPSFKEQKRFQYLEDTSAYTFSQIFNRLDSKEFLSYLQYKLSLLYSLGYSHKSLLQKKVFAYYLHQQYSYSSNGSCSSNGNNKTNEGEQIRMRSETPSLEKERQNSNANTLNAKSYNRQIPFSILQKKKALLECYTLIRRSEGVRQPVEPILDYGPTSSYLPINAFSFARQKSLASATSMQLPISGNDSTITQNSHTRNHLGSREGYPWSDYWSNHWSFSNKISNQNHNQNKSVTASPLQSIFLTYLPVLPPDLRPIVQVESGKFATSDVNDLYRFAIFRNNRLKRFLQQNVPEAIFYQELRLVQHSVDALFDNSKLKQPISRSPSYEQFEPLKSLSDRLAGKRGRFRLNLLGKRVDYSGRSVIVVGPKLRLFQCGLPIKMAFELFFPFLIQRVLQKAFAKTTKTAKLFLRENTEKIREILNDVVNSHPVILNRAPTLHRMGVQAFLPILVEGKAIQLHPLMCPSFNADFDGDQMAVHIPLRFESQIESRFLMLSPHNWISPADGDTIINMSQDMILGFYYLTFASPSGEKVREFSFKAPPSEEKAKLLSTESLIGGSGNIMLNQEYMEYFGDQTNCERKEVANTSSNISNENEIETLATTDKTQTHTPTPLIPLSEGFSPQECTRFKNKIHAKLWIDLSAYITSISNHTVIPSNSVEASTTKINPKFSYQFSYPPKISCNSNDSCSSDDTNKIEYRGNSSQVSELKYKVKAVANQIDHQLAPAYAITKNQNDQYLISAILSRTGSSYYIYPTLIQFGDTFGFSRSTYMFTTIGRLIFNNYLVRKML